MSRSKWKIEVKKLTDEGLLHTANSFTSGRESKQSLKSAYRMGHSTIRTQIFLVELYDIPQYVAYHFRTHFSLFPMPPEEYGWMMSKRIDKGGGDFRETCREIAGDMIDAYRTDNTESIVAVAEQLEALPENYDRYAPTNFAFMVSAEGLINMASKRLCIGAVSEETREVMEDICEEVKIADPDLYPHLVRPCIATGICREKCCGFIRSELYRKLRMKYKSLFTSEGTLMD